jgi:outer membrane protein assembly factor BamB
MRIPSEQDLLRLMIQVLSIRIEVIENMVYCFDQDTGEIIYIYEHGPPETL